jgi:hypothetical protein
MARSSVSNAPTLLSSSGAAAGAGAAAFADFVKLKVATDPTATTAIRATTKRLVTTALQLAIHVFIFFSPG